MCLSAQTSMSQSQNPTIRLLNADDPPQCPLPVLLGPATQSACFSICNQRLEVDSIAALRYFVSPPPNPNFNLRDGLQRFLRLPFKQRAFQRARRLDNVFATCLAARNSEELLKAEVVTWRGIMKKIMLGEKLDLNVSYYKGVLYLEEDSTRTRFDNNSEGTYMGHRFETFCTTAAPNGEADGGAVDMHTLWNAAITRKLGALNILLVGEVDCVTPNYLENPGPQNYMELKTKRVEGTNYSITSNRSKWEMQSYLLGTPEIFVGFVDPAGVVRSTRTLAVRDVQSAAQHRIDWGARVIHALREFCAVSTETENGALKVWRVEARNKYVDVRELNVGEVRKLNK
ncbi:hypothetical protein DFH09DRAFT_1457321, partial [Mycena vulgaris]